MYKREQVKEAAMKSVVVIEVVVGGWVAVQRDA